MAADATVIQPRSAKRSAYEFKGNSVRMVINGEVVNLGDLLSIPVDPQGLFQAMADHADLASWLGMVAIDAEADAEAAKKELETVYADVYLDIRREFVKEGGKFTENLLEAEVKLSDDYRDALSEYLSLERRSKAFGIVKDSLRSRGVLLASMAGIVRDEVRNYHSGSAA